MKRPLYYRMLLSYLPVFFFITSFLFFIFFQEINAQSRKDAERANEVLIQSAIDQVEHAMESLDYALAHFSIYNQVLYQYLQTEGINQVMLNSRMLKEIAEFKRQNPIVDSVYLVRSQDHTVLTEKYIFPLQEFPDTAYIEYLQQGPKSLQWSAPRTYIDFNQSHRVVTLAKYVFLTKGDPCIVVANVNTETIRAITEPIYNPATSFISIEHANGEPIFEEKSVPQPHKKVLSENQSAYLGWKFHSGIMNGQWLSILSNLSSLWMILGVVIVILGLMSIIYITRKNYEPLELVVAKLRSLASERREDKVRGQLYEYAVIESAFANMLKQNMHLQKQKEDGGLRKNHFMLGILEGAHRISEEEWTVEMKRHRFPPNYHELCVMLIEIDEYPDFAQKFSKHDQFLLKYAISNAAPEILQKNKLWGLCDWVTDKRLSCILVSSSSLQDQRDNVILAGEEMIAWIKAHLPCSASIGIGSSVAHANDLPNSYKDAKTALKYKMTQGIGTVSSFGNMVAGPRTELFGRLQTIHAMVQFFRLGHPDWEKKFFELFDEIRSSRLLSDDIISLLNYMIFQLDRAIGELGAEYRDPWQGKGLQSLTEILEREETLTAIMNAFHDTLSAIRSEIDEAKETRGHYEILQAVREYIEQHYTNADLSLDRLSDAFHLNPKYLSQLFKENFGERFMEFLTQLRIEQAKLLLMETKDSVQEISGQVGYANVVSFMRSFKKTTGKSPGDFRKTNKRISG